VKSGKKIEIRKKIKVNLNDYQDAHLKHGCNGKFKLGFSINGYYEGSALGPVLVPCLLMVECPKCGAVHYVSSFTDILDQIIATNLVTSKQLLSKKHIKFLRQYFDMTQEEMGKLLKVDRFEISKMELFRQARVMSPEKQIIMKMKFAKILKIKDVESLYEITDYEDKEVEIKEDWFPTKSELKDKVAA